MSSRKGPQTTPKRRGRKKTNSAVLLFAFNANVCSSSGGRPKRQLKSVKRFDPTSTDSNPRCRVGEGFPCPECSATCSYDSRACEECGIECYYEAGVGAVILKSRRASSLKRSPITNVQPPRKKRQQVCRNSAWGSDNGNGKIDRALPIQSTHEIGGNTLSNQSVNHSRSSSRKKNQRNQQVSNHQVSESDGDRGDGVQNESEDMSKMTLSVEQKPKARTQSGATIEMGGEHMPTNNGGENEDLKKQVSRLTSERDELEKQLRATRKVAPQRLATPTAEGLGLGYTSDQLQEHNTILMGKLEALQLQLEVASSENKKLDERCTKATNLNMEAARELVRLEKKAKASNQSCTPSNVENCLGETIKLLQEENAGLKDKNEGMKEKISSLMAKVSMLTSEKDELLDQVNATSIVATPRMTLAETRNQVLDPQASNNKGKQRIQGGPPQQDKNDPNKVQSSAFNANGCSSTRQRPKRKLKSVKRFDPTSTASHARCRVGEGFTCPECSATCSYDSRACEGCGLECYYERGVGVVMLKKRQDSSVCTHRCGSQYSCAKESLLREDAASWTRRRSARLRSKRGRTGHKTGEHAEANPSFKKKAPAGKAAKKRKSPAAKAAKKKKGGRTVRSLVNMTKTTGGIIDDELPEELQGLDKELIEKINSEIVFSGEKVSFKDIIGLEHAKRAAHEMVLYPMKRPDLYTGLLAPQKGLLLFGPPGTGKTLFGKAVAQTSGATFFGITSSSLTSKWEGEGEKLVRTLFAVASFRSPSVVFFDEVDSLLTQRTKDDSEASRRMKNEFFAQIDGVQTSKESHVLFIGATNKPWELDDAMRRRFDARLYIPLPKQPGREALLRNLLKGNKHILTDTELMRLSRDTRGFSGADLKVLCEDAAKGPIRTLGERHIRMDARDIPPIEYEHFRSSLRSIKPSVAQTDLAPFEIWNNNYGSTVSKRGERSDDDDGNKKEVYESGFCVGHKTML